jgi:hypothetical protein
MRPHRQGSVHPLPPPDHSPVAAPAWQPFRIVIEGETDGHAWRGGLVLEGIRTLAARAILEDLVDVGKRSGFAPKTRSPIVTP